MSKLFLEMFFVVCLSGAHRHHEDPLLRHLALARRPQDGGRAPARDVRVRFEICAAQGVKLKVNIMKYHEMLMKC